MHGRWTKKSGGKKLEAVSKIVGPPINKRRKQKNRSALSVDKKYVGRKSRGTAIIVGPKNKRHKQKQSLNVLMQ